MGRIERNMATQHEGNRFVLIWAGVLIIWFLLISLLPDPRPLGAPEFVTKSVESALNVSHQVAAIFSTIALRGMGLAVIGILLVQALRTVPLRIGIPIALLLAPILAVIALWINYMYFPLQPQIFIATISAVSGVLLGLVLHKTRWALIALVLFLGGLFAWGTSTGVSDDFYAVAEETGRHILISADEVPKGDAGFEKLIKIAFAFAEDNSHRHDPVLANRAAILALGVILGEEKVATVAKREINLKGLEISKQLRNRITVYGRGDLPRHFWVSAGLAIVSDSETSMSIGITKELMDSAGGSGFSFVDLTADRAGTLFYESATRDEASARAMQELIRNGAVVSDFIPNALDLPEGITRDDFQNKYGGLGGKPSQKIVTEIVRRLTTCRALF